MQSWEGHYYYIIIKEDKMKKKKWKRNKKRSAVVGARTSSKNVRLNIYIWNIYNILKNYLLSHSISILFSILNEKKNK